MSELKTKPTKISVKGFLDAIPDAQVRKDCWTIVKMMQDSTKAKPEMWGPSIVGFGRRKLIYPNGRELDWMVTGFSPRKGKLVLYVMDGSETQQELLTKLGKHSSGKGCLYIKRLDGVDVAVLKQVVQAAVKRVESKSSGRGN